jgi:hypothetical protein
MGAIKTGTYAGPRATKQACFACLERRNEMSGIVSGSIVREVLADNRRSTGRGARASATRRALVRALSCSLAGVVAALAVLSLAIASAGAAGVPRCVGTTESPGVLAGRFPSNVNIEGICVVNVGSTLVNGNLTVRPGGALLAAYGGNTGAVGGRSSLTVRGTLRVQAGASLVLGCDPSSFPCLDDPNPENPTISS